jgi:hypothetical protein
MTPNINRILEQDPATSRFDSHMGRPNLDLKGSREKLYLQRVKLDENKKDVGGYSWSTVVDNQRIYSAFNEAGTIQLFVKSPDRKRAKLRLYTVFGVKFFN